KLLRLAISHFLPASGPRRIGNVAALSQPVMDSFGSNSRTRTRLYHRFLGSPDIKPHANMRNIKVILAYDGTEFAGWQVQPERVTIQGALSAAIEQLTKERVLPQGSGRTDAGVHALAQVATFTTESSIPIENFGKALNSVLPDSIRILEASE